MLYCSTSKILEDKEEQYVLNSKIKKILNLQAH